MDRWRGARRPSRRRAFALLPPLALALAPKCPLCVLGFAGFLGAVPVASQIYRNGLGPLTAAALLVAVLAVGVECRRAGGYAPAVAASSGAIALFAGKFWLDSVTLHYAGLAVLLASGLWSYWRQRRPEATVSCPSC